MDKIKEEHQKNKTVVNIDEIHNKGIEKIIDNSLGFLKSAVVSETLSMKLQEASKLKILLLLYKPYLN